MTERVGFELMILYELLVFFEVKIFLFLIYFKKKFKLVLSWNLVLGMEFIYLTVNYLLIMDGMVFHRGDKKRYKSLLSNYKIIKILVVLENLYVQITI